MGTGKILSVRNSVVDPYTVQFFISFHQLITFSINYRNVPAGDASMKAGRWDRKLFMGSELGGKTLAVLGLGQIGKQVAVRMQSYGMRTIGFDPFVTKEQAAEFGVERMK